VGRACVLAREIIEIVHAYNEQSQKAGLPTLELGIGISYQAGAPMYLMDSGSQIMISRALNESDRLSSCSRGARQHLAGRQTPFSVFSFRAVEDALPEFAPEELLIRYNVGGISLEEAAFLKLAQEISLQPIDRRLHTVWDMESVKLHSGLVPVDQGAFRRLVVREAKVARIHPRDFSFKGWTEQKYYEVCSDQAIYDAVEGANAARA